MVLFKGPIRFILCSFYPFTSWGFILFVYLSVCLCVSASKAPERLSHDRLVMVIINKTGKNLSVL